MNFTKLLLPILLVWLAPLRNIAQCPASLTIYEQADVVSFVTDYPNCHALPGDLIITDTIRDADGNVTNSTTDITDLSALSILTSIGGSLSITGCPLLPSLTGLDNVTSVGADFYLYNNDHTSFTSLAGLGSLTHVTNRVTVRLMDNLETFAGMGTLTGSLLYEIKITDNPKLASIAPLSGITSTGTDVTIKRNKLPNLEGLNSLSTVGGFLDIQEEVDLLDISQLASLTTVGFNPNANGGINDLNISQNPLLTNLTGLEQMTSISGDLYLNLNPELGDCDAVCPMVVAGGAGGLSVGSNKSMTPCAYNTALQNHCAALLPIELMDFSSQSNNEVIILNWMTATETNNDEFIIEKSHNGRDWEAIGWIEGNGTTQEEHAYRLVDEAPSTGINYYRLKQIDFNGAYQYSHVISEFIFADHAGNVSIFPNPASHTLYIQHTLTEKLSITIFDALGRQLIQTMDYANGIDLSTVGKGIYTVQVRHENAILETQKLVVIK